MLGEDAGIKHTLNRYARRAAVGAVDSYGETALRLVSDTIRGWDVKTITDRLENAVGDDLQYIRINGTLVGGLGDRKSVEYGKRVSVRVDFGGGRYHTKQ